MSTDEELRRALRDLIDLGDLIDRYEGVGTVTGEGVTWHRCACSENCGQIQPGPGFAARFEPREEGLTIASAEVPVGQWFRSSKSVAEGYPPHARPGEPAGRIALDVIWADPERRVPVAANDYDGCYTVVARAATPRAEGLREACERLMAAFDWTRAGAWVGLSDAEWTALYNAVRDIRAALAATPPAEGPPWDYWRKQLTWRDVDPTLTWTDADVMRVVRDLVEAHDAVTPQAEGLDVDRLARALHEAGIRCSPNIPYCRATHRGHAARILAALAPEQPE